MRHAARSLPLILAAAALAGCKRDAQKEPRAERPADGASDPVATAPNPVVVPDAAPAPDLPPPSTALGPVPDELAGIVTLEVVARGLKRPVLVVVAPDDARRRLFVLEQHVARVRIIENGKVADKPFLDLGGKVSTGNEQGLLSMAFHPEFATNRKLYVYYTDRDDDSRIDEYQVSATDPDVVDPSTRREVYRLRQPYSNHNGAHLLFGTDGTLYFGLGDGGSAGDPKRAGQDPRQQLAKMLRLDVDAAAPKAEILAMGVRNPWRWDFDPATQDVYIGDVGQNEWEYVHAIPAGTLEGRNFGWNVVEGSHCYDARRCDKEGFTLPVVEYPHDEGCSVTGGMVYRGKALPELDGVYFYADYCIGWIRSFRWRPDGVRQHWDWRPVLDPDAQLSQVSSFGRDHDGELYVMSLGGTIWKIARK